MEDPLRPIISVICWMVQHAELRMHLSIWVCHGITLSGKRLISKIHSKQHMMRVDSDGRYSKILVSTTSIYLILCQSFQFPMPMLAFLKNPIVTTKGCAWTLRIVLKCILEKKILTILPVLWWNTIGFAAGPESLGAIEELPKDIDFARQLLILSWKLPRVFTFHV